MDEFIMGQQAARAAICEDNTATNMLTLLGYVKIRRQSLLKAIASSYWRGLTMVTI